jgi:glycolate oxidase iron-sulfur subunit
METHLADFLKGTSQGAVAESILRKCVHCGFCTATCPTYQLLGDELDGPRGRIYLIKQVVEGKPATAETLSHLDRCLTCRNCESTCPSGVQYGRLVDIGRALVEAQVERPFTERLLRGALREGMTRRWLFDPAMKLGQALRPVLPKSIQAKVPKARAQGLWPSQVHARKVLILNGCVQPAMMPSIDAATARVLNRIGVQTLVESRSGCCGAVRHHLNDHEGGLRDIKRNIDAWWPYFSEPLAGEPASPLRAEALLINASGCGAMIKDYAHLLRDDPAYLAKAHVIVDKTFDLAEWLPAALQLAKDQGRLPLDPESLSPGTPKKLVFHPPCTLQHGQQVKGEVERFLTGLGIGLTSNAEAHLCCGSAGTYSVLQPELSLQLRDRKLSHLESGQPEMILSANIGCLGHLQSGTQTPVRHWIEWLDDAMTVE